jgi:hypothetical protein
LLFAAKTDDFSLQLLYCSPTFLRVNEVCTNNEEK